MQPPRPRGPLSEQIVEALSGSPEGDGFRHVAAPSPPTSVLDDDVQLSLWMLYELHYRGFDGVPDHEWNPHAISVRRRLEDAFEHELRGRTATQLEQARTHSRDLVEQVAWLTEAFDAPNLAGYLHREATVEQVRGFLAQRSLYHLKESDPHSFVLPRLDGRAKVALAEIQYDEYGAGRPGRLHSDLFADALEGCGLDRTYGAYVDETPAAALAVNNVMSLFALNRRLRGAAMGHLAAFESTSSLPCRRIAAGIERVGLPEVVAAYFHEHVEADAVHEQVAVRDLCGSLVQAEPGLHRDVLFGVAACAYLDSLAAERLLASWRGRPSVAEPMPEAS